jgi:predicted transposase/invertase (TIGR01784 family)
MIIGIEPTVDYASKYLFGRESTKPILIDVLNEIRQLSPGKRIEEIELLNPFNPKETSGDKLSIMDIRARDQTGRMFNIEMQLSAYLFYEKRILYYAVIAISRLFSLKIREERMRRVLHSLRFPLPQF